MSTAKPPVIDAFTGEHRFLSNFFNVMVQLDGKKYPSVENAYQAAKTLNGEDRKLFQHCGSYRAKQLGRSLMLRPDWEEKKLTIMEELLRQKFADEVCKRLLLSTQDAELVEGNHWGDTFWGVCGGRGHNHLGRLLMKIRSEISEGTTHEQVPHLSS